MNGKVAECFRWRAISEGELPYDSASTMRLERGSFGWGRNECIHTCQLRRNQLPLNLIGCRHERSRRRDPVDPGLPNFTRQLSVFGITICQHERAGVIIHGPGLLLLIILCVQF